MTQEEKLAATKAVAGRWVVVEHKGKRLFCDGHVILPVEGMDEGSEGYLVKPMVERTPELWEQLSVAEQRSQLERRGLYGYPESATFYRALSRKIEVQERYVRLFPEDATFEEHAILPNILIVRSKSEVIGGLMPLRPSGIEKSWPPINATDAEVYVIPSTDDDADDCDCEECMGTGQCIKCDGTGKVGKA